MIDNTAPQSAPLEAFAIRLKKALSAEEKFKQILVTMAERAADGIINKKGSGATFYSKLGPLTIKMEVEFSSDEKSGKAGGGS